MRFTAHLCGRLEAPKECTANLSHSPPHLKTASRIDARKPLLRLRSTSLACSKDIVRVASVSESGQAIRSSGVSGQGDCGDSAGCFFSDAHCVPFLPPGHILRTGCSLCVQTCLYRLCTVLHRQCDRYIPHMPLTHSERIQHCIHHTDPEATSQSVPWTLQ